MHHCHPWCRMWMFDTLLQSTEKLDFWHIAAVHKKIPWPALWIFVTMLQSTEKHLAKFVDFCHHAAIHRKLGLLSPCCSPQKNSPPQSWGAKSLQSQDHCAVDLTNQIEMTKNWSQPPQTLGVYFHHGSLALLYSFLLKCTQVTPHFLPPFSLCQ